MLEIHLVRSFTGGKISVWIESGWEGTTSLPISMARKFIILLLCSACCLFFVFLLFCIYPYRMYIYNKTILFRCHFMQAVFHIWIVVHLANHHCQCKYNVHVSTISSYFCILKITSMSGVYRDSNPQSLLSLEKGGLNMSRYCLYNSSHINVSWKKRHLKIFFPHVLHFALIET